MKYIPKPIKLLLRPVYIVVKPTIDKLLDLFDVLIDSKNPLIPPRSMIFIGDGDYQKTGDEFFEYFKEYGELKPEAKVLDVGCGIGRMSLPLTNYLSGEGEYTGFDIVSEGINWCKVNITSRYPNFNFAHSDIYNKMYNPKGTRKSDEYKFEFCDNYFDFVFLTSVFTHMYTQDITRYLEEISRVLKIKGRCLITFFLLNEESISLIKDKKSTQELIYKLDNNSYTKNYDVPENAIGFNEDYVKKIFNENGLNIIHPIHYGSWCGRNNFISYQDIIVAEKS